MCTRSQTPFNTSILLFFFPTVLRNHVPNMCKLIGHAVCLLYVTAMSYKFLLHCDIILASDWATKVIVHVEVDSISCKQVRTWWQWINNARRRTTPWPNLKCVGGKVLLVMNPLCLENMATLSRSFVLPLPALIRPCIAICNYQVVVYTGCGEYTITAINVQTRKLFLSFQKLVSALEDENSWFRNILVGAHVSHEAGNIHAIFDAINEEVAYEASRGSALLWASEAGTRCCVSQLSAASGHESSAVSAGDCGHLLPNCVHAWLSDAPETPICFSPLEWSRND